MFEIHDITPNAPSPALPVIHLNGSFTKSTVPATAPATACVAVHAQFKIPASHWVTTTPGSDTLVVTFDQSNVVSGNAVNAVFVAALIHEDHT